MSIIITVDIADSLGATCEVTAAAGLSSSAQPVTMGDAIVEAGNDGGNGNLLVAQKATLAQAATLQSLSFYVTTPAGSLRLGIYDATGSGGGPGKKLIEAVLTPVAGWNTVGVAPTALPAGVYWLVYLPSSGALGFRNVNTGSAKWANFAFGTMPSTFPSSSSSGTVQWSFYATLLPAAPASQFVVSVVSSPADAGTVTGADVYAAGALATLVATPNPLWDFDHWEDSAGNVLGTSPVLTFPVTRDT